VEKRKEGNSHPNLKESFPITSMIVFPQKEKFQPGGASLVRKRFAAFCESGEKKRKGSLVFRNGT